MEEEVAEKKKELDSVGALTVLLRSVIPTSVSNDTVASIAKINILLIAYFDGTLNDENFITLVYPMLVMGRMINQMDY